MRCPLCRTDDENRLWQDAHCRIIRVDDPDYAGFCRVIWQAHVAEMSDLAPDARQHLMDTVVGLEAAMRECFAPTKINLASLGNMVPHLHWHVIARFADDAHFPDPIWAPRRRDPGPQPAVDDATLREALARHLCRKDD